VGCIRHVPSADVGRYPWAILADFSWFSLVVPVHCRESAVFFRILPSFLPSPLCRWKYWQRHKITPLQRSILGVKCRLNSGNAFYLSIQTHSPLCILPKSPNVAPLNTSFCLFSGWKTYLLPCEKLGCVGYLGPGRSGEHVDVMERKQQERLA